jgi:hypothetical protein
MCFNSQTKVSAIMPQLKIPEPVFNDLGSFISKNYQNYLPNSLLIAQAFILKHQDYGREFGLSAINCAIEDGIKHGLF